MIGVRWNRDKYYFIISAVITDAERNVACMIVQYEENWVFTRWFDTILKILKPVKEQFLINPSISGARINCSNRTTLLK
jgi:hypothetical protein